MSKDNTVAEGHEISQSLPDTRECITTAPNVKLTVLTEPPDLQITEEKASYKRKREIFRGRDLVRPYRIG